MGERTLTRMAKVSSRALLGWVSSPITANSGNWGRVGGRSYVDAHGEGLVEGVVGLGEFADNGEQR